MTRAVAVAVAVAALHATAVTGLLATTAPTWRPATGERSPLGVFLIPTPPIASDREPSSRFAAVPGALCSRTYEVDERGNLYFPGAPGRAFLRSLPAGSDGHLPAIAVLCEPVTIWSKRIARPPMGQSPWEPAPPEVFAL